MELRTALVLAVVLTFIGIGSLFFALSPERESNWLARVPTTTQLRGTNDDNLIATATPDNTRECEIPGILVGTWEETDGPPGYTLELRADGNYADKRNGIVAVFVDRLKAFTFQNNLATTTGRWAIVTDHARESAEYDTRYPRLPPLRLPDDGIILKQEFGRGPWYYKIVFRDGCSAFAQTPMWMQEDEPGYVDYEYRRLTAVPQ